MSCRTKREVVLPPRTIASSSDPPCVPMPLTAPYSYGGPWLLTPLPAWFASPSSQALPSSPLCPLPTTSKTNVQLDLEERGVESRSPGGFVNFINTPSNHIHHVAEGSPSQPINVENGGAARPEKRLSWTKDEDLRLRPTLVEEISKLICGLRLVQEFGVLQEIQPQIDLSNGSASMRPADNQQPHGFSISSTPSDHNAKRRGRPAGRPPGSGKKRQFQALGSCASPSLHLDHQGRRGNKQPNPDLDMICLPFPRRSIRAAIAELQGLQN